MRKSRRAVWRFALCFVLVAAAVVAVPVVAGAYSQPPVSHSPASLDFAFGPDNMSPQTRTLTISVGDIPEVPAQYKSMASATWSVTHSLSWLTLNPSSGSAGLNSSFQINVTVDPTGLQQGVDYQSQITVNVQPPTIPNFPGAPTGFRLFRPMAAGSTDVPIHAYVAAPASAPAPTLVLHPAQLTFGATLGSNPASQSLHVATEGSSTLGWTASDDADWLSVSPASGSGSTTLSVSADTTGLAAGVYDATITVSAPGATNTPVYERVRLNIARRRSSMSIRVSRTTLAFGGAASIDGTLTGDVTVLEGRTIVLEQAFTPRGPWTQVTSTVNPPAAYSVRPTRRTYYRWRFAGDATYAPSSSTVILVTPQVFIAVPMTNGVWRYRTPTLVYGYLKPKHASGAYNVRLYFEHWEGRWVTRSIVAARNANYNSYTKFSAAPAMLYRGSWRVRALYVATSTNPAAYSAYRYFVVR